MKRSIFLTSIAILTVAGLAQAATLSEYRHSVVTARAYVRDLDAYISSEDHNTVTEADLVESIRKALPSTSSVEQPGGTLDASNEWFHANLDEFEKEQDNAKRTAILRATGERLDALIEKLTELESTVSGERSKDEDKRKLAEILQREEYQKPKPAEESLISRWFRAFLDWLESLLPKAPQTQPQFSGMPNLAFILQIVLYAVIAGLIIFGIYKLAPRVVPSLKRKREAKRKDRVILGERIADDASAVDLFAEAEQLAKQGDLRGAIRKGYIALICDLSDKRLIGLARHKTNRDYLREIRSRRELLTRMSGVTNEFEQSWYGSRAADAGDWKGFRDACEKTMQIARAEA